MSLGKKILIIGATSAIAEHCARIWASREGGEFFLLARSEDKLNKIIDDLKIRNLNIIAHAFILDFLNTEAISSLVAKIFKHNRIDIVLIAHGVLIPEVDCQKNLAICRQSLEINGVSPALFAEACVREMALKNYGILAVISSVAADRSRKARYVYGAGKALLSHYILGLQHRFLGSAVKVILIKPGPTDTPMTYGEKAKGIPMAKVELVANTIVSGIERGKTIIYAPKIWALIMVIIRNLPAFIFNKLTR